MIFKRLKYLLTAPAELDELIEDIKTKAADEERIANRSRLDLCYRHRQEQNNSHFSPHNCDYCKLEEKINNLTKDQS